MPPAATFRIIISILGAAVRFAAPIDLQTLKTDHEGL